DARGQWPVAPILAPTLPARHSSAPAHLQQLHLEDQDGAGGHVLIRCRAVPMLGRDDHAADAAEPLADHADVHAARDHRAADLELDGVRREVLGAAAQPPGVGHLDPIAPPDLVGPLAHLQVLDVDAGLEPDHGAEDDAERGIEVRLLDDLELDVRLSEVAAEAADPAERGERNDSAARPARGG